MKIFQIFLILITVDCSFGQYSLECKESYMTMMAGADALDCEITFGAAETNSNNYSETIHTFRIHDQNVTNDLLNLVLEDFPDVTDVSFHRCNLEDYNNETFKNAGHLKTLALADCLECQFEFTFQHLSNLTFLFMMGNSIKTLNEDFLVGLRNLINLFMSDNHIRVLHSNCFKNSLNLQRIDLKNNEIEEIPVDIFTELTNLESIDLANNFLKTFQCDFTKSNKQIKKLELGNNQIEYLQEAVIESFKNLTFLDLSANICVDQQFNYRVKPNNPEKILKVVLFPFCYEDFDRNQLESKERSLIVLVGFIAALTLMISLVLAFFVKNRLKIVHPGMESKRSLTKLIQEFTSESSVHGIKYLGERKSHWTEK